MGENAPAANFNLSILILKLVLRDFVALHLQPPPQLHRLSAQRSLIRIVFEDIIGPCRLFGV